MEARFKIWDSVLVRIDGQKFEGKIYAIKFTSDKVFYDISVEAGNGLTTVVQCVDSVFVETLAGVQTR